MKVAPSADYPVRVLRQEWEEENSLYAGIFAVTLNHTVDIAFIPDLSPVAPPWEELRLPEDLDAITTPEQARLATALLTPYVVTPNDARAGGDETFSSDGDRHIVYYVSATEFDEYAAELAALSTTAAGSLRSQPQVSALRDQHPVVRFIETRIVGSGQLQPQHAFMLGQA